MMRAYNLAGMICAAFAAGALSLAVIDKTVRMDYFDLAKIALGGYLGYVTPRKNPGEG